MIIDMIPSGIVQDGIISRICQHWDGLEKFTCQIQNHRHGLYHHHQWSISIQESLMYLKLYPNAIQCGCVWSAELHEWQ
jgi:hypothetical protein